MKYIKENKDKPLYEDESLSRTVCSISRVICEIFDNKKFFVNARVSEWEVRIKTMSEYEEGWSTLKSGLDPGVTELLDFNNSDMIDNQILIKFFVTFSFNNISAMVDDKTDRMRLNAELLEDMADTMDSLSKHGLILKDWSESGSIVRSSFSFNMENYFEKRNNLFKDINN